MGKLSTTIQCLKDNGQKDKQWSAKHYMDSKNMGTLNTRDEPMCSGRVCRFCSSSGTRRVAVKRK